jgi:site-specific DNA-cytosine methylase
MIDLLLGGSPCQGFSSPYAGSLEFDGDENL